MGSAGVRSVAPPGFGQLVVVARARGSAPPLPPTTVRATASPRVPATSAPSALFLTR